MTTRMTTGRLRAGELAALAAATAVVVAAWWAITAPPTHGPGWLRVAGAALVAALPAWARVTYGIARRAADEYEAGLTSTDA